MCRCFRCFLGFRVIRVRLLPLHVALDSFDDFSGLLLLDGVSSGNFLLHCFHVVSQSCLWFIFLALVCGFLFLWVIILFGMLFCFFCLGCVLRVCVVAFTLCWGVCCGGWSCGWVFGVVRLACILFYNWDYSRLVG